MIKAAIFFEFLIHQRERRTYVENRFLKLNRFHENKSNFFFHSFIIFSELLMIILQTTIFKYFDLLFKKYIEYKEFERSYFNNFISFLPLSQF